MRFLSKFVKRGYMIVLNDSENEEGLLIPTEEINMLEAIKKSDIILYRLNRGEANKYRFSLNKIAEYNLVPLSDKQEITNNSQQEKTSNNIGSLNLQPAGNNNKTDCPCCNEEKVVVCNKNDNPDDFDYECEACGEAWDDELSSKQKTTQTEDVE